MLTVRARVQCSSFFCHLIPDFKYSEQPDRQGTDRNEYPYQRRRHTGYGSGNVTFQPIARQPPAVQRQFRIQEQYVSAKRMILSVSSTWNTKLTPSGEIRLKAYNHANDMYKYLNGALTTQGVGVMFKKKTSPISPSFSAGEGSYYRLSRLPLPIQSRRRRLIQLL